MSDGPDIRSGDGWAAAGLDDLGEGWGFRKIRAALGVEAFGVNAIVLPPRYEAGPHFHDEQQELYFVHRGRVELEVDDDVLALEAGGLARVDGRVVRRLRNPGTEDAVVLVVGGHGGYVGRDAHLPEGDHRPGGPLDA